MKLECLLPSSQEQGGENIGAQEGGEDRVMKACIILNFSRQNQDEHIKEEEMGRAYSKLVRVMSLMNLIHALPS